MVNKMVNKEIDRQTEADSGGPGRVHTRARLFAYYPSTAQASQDRQPSTSLPKDEKDSIAEMMPHQ
jgi:hypothetical protein